MSEYRPVPPDLSDVELPADLGAITERLAEHIHDVWARERLADGWTLGPERNDDSKQHPSLVPYDQLPERERDYDRLTALNTLKFIMKLGYQIVPPEHSEPGEPPTEFERLKEIGARFRSGQPVRTRELWTEWRQREAPLWALHPEFYGVLANTLLKRGYPLWANDVLTEGLRIAPNSVRLKQLHALALMRTGRPRRARRILEGLIAEDEQNATGETLGLLASSHKVSWTSAPDDAEKQKSLEQSCRIYQSAFEQTREYYPGINAAAMAIVSGQLDTGRRIAAEVETICHEAVRAGDNSYWTLATLAEAALIEGEPNRATEFYEQAVTSAPDDIDSISATRRQALMLAERLEIDDTAIRRALPVPPVAIFGGAPCWSDNAVRLPSIQNENAFRSELRKQIRSSGLKMAYASGVGGGDLLFLETVIEEGGEANLILPAPAEDLANFFANLGTRGVTWAERLNRVLSQASSMTVVSRDLGSANPEVFSYANRILTGASVLKAKSLGTPVHLIELESTAGPVHAFERTETFEKVNRLRVAGIDEGDAISTSTGGLSAEIKGILFADLKGYSQISESEIPLFINEFLGGAGQLCDSEPGLEYRNTWGDAFYLVFDQVGTAADFAKRLRSFVKDTNWRKRGFSQDFGIRISLHAGPLFSFKDPVLHARTFSGQHASRAARIEPITDEGQIFVSEPFACLAAEADASDPQFEYLGRRALAKKYGDEGLFMLL